MKRTLDLNAPRFRPEAEAPCSRKCISHMRKKSPELKGLSNGEVREILKTFNEVICENVINHRDGVMLPETLGKLFIGSCPKKKSKNVDFKSSNEHNRVVQHRNWESDNFMAKIFYSTFDLKHSYQNHELWGFKGCRNFTRSVGRTYPEKWKLYVQIDPGKQIAGMFRQTMERIERRERTEDLLVTYDEFEF